MAKKHDTKAFGPVDQAIRHVINDSLQDFEDDLASEDGPIMKTLLSALDKRLSGIGGNEDAAQNAVSAVRDWLSSELGRALLAEAVKGPIDEMEARLTGMIREAKGLDRDEVQRLVRESAPASAGVPGDVEEKIKAVVEESLGSVLAEEAKELIVRIKQDLKNAMDEKLSDFADSKSLAASVRKAVEDVLEKEGVTSDDVTKQIEETIKVAISGALGSTMFSDAVAEVVAEKGGGGAKVDEGAMREIIREEGKKVTEEILMREAQGLVKQVKLEVGKVQKQIDKVAQQGGGVKAEDIEKMKTEIEEAISGKIEKFLDSDDFKGLVGSIAEDKTKAAFSKPEIKAALAGAAKGGSEGGGMLSPVQIQSLVESAIIAKMKDAPAGGGGMNQDAVKALVDETLKISMAKHVGKFLDEKLPPPEYFESLATMSQVREEIEKKVSGSGAGVARPAGGGVLAGNPGESAVFTNLITRILGSDDLKEMIDDKFKVINNYVKNELVPKVVKKILDEEKGK